MNSKTTVFFLSLTVCFLFKGNSGVDDLADSLQKGSKISKSLSLCRLNSQHELVATYTDKVQFSKGPQLALNQKTCKARTKYVGTLPGQDRFKNHLLISNFVIDPLGTIQRPLLSTDPFKGIISSSSNLVVDWTSHGSSVPLSKKLHKRISSSGNGHSEPQFVDDFNALFVKDHPSIVKLFTQLPAPISEYSAYGLELYSSFDACDACLDTLVKFRAQHQTGQQSLSQSIQDKLKDKFKGKAQDNFVLLYNAHYPYKESTYHGEDENNFYPFDYNYDVAPQRSDVFKRKGFEEIHTLRPHRRTSFSAPTSIFHHLHLLSGQQRNYQVKSSSFIF